MLEDMFFVEGCVFAIPRAAPRSIQASYRGQTSMLGVAVVEDEDVTHGRRQRRRKKERLRQTREIEAESGLIDAFDPFSASPRMFESPHLPRGSVNQNGEIVQP